MERIEAARAALDRFPKIPLGAFPTPIERLEAPSIPGGGRIWVKREDLAAPSYGGNKVRKLELLLAAGRGPIVAFGGTGSHHVLATAIHGAGLGRPCWGVVAAQPETPHAAAVRDLNATRCEVVTRLGHPAEAGRLAAWIASAALRGRAPTILAPGGSSPLGTLGWVGGGLELAAQIAEGACDPIDEIYVAYGSGGTAVGLALGLALAGATCVVIAVRVATRLVGNAGFARLLARRSFALLDPEGRLGPMPRLRLSLEHRFAGPGYGHPTPEAEEGVALARAWGLPAEPTYTGKALAALLAAARSDPRRARLFLDTYSSIDKLGTTRG